MGVGSLSYNKKCTITYLGSGWPSTEGLWLSEDIEIWLFSTDAGNPRGEEADTMTILDLMVVLGYTATIFSIGYMLGYNASKQK